MTKRIGFFPAHPSQFWMMKALAEYAPSNVEILWYLRDKDISVTLMKHTNFPFQVVSRAGTGIFGNFKEMIRNIYRFYSITKTAEIDLWLSKYGAVNIAAKLLGRHSLSFNDDDADVVPLIALTSYPFADEVLCTNWTRMGKYETFATRYPAFHELFYLHPKRFCPKKSAAEKLLNLRNKERYAIIRLSSLLAHHDVGESGISDSILTSIIQELETQYRVFISSEKPLKMGFESYRLPISPVDIHTVLAHASLVIGDSQTMIGEASVLGVPSLRVSSFAGRIGSLDELERRKLCWSVHPDNEELILRYIKFLMEIDPKAMKARREKLIKETIDPVPFFWQQMGKYL